MDIPPGFANTYVGRSEVIHDEDRILFFFFFILERRKNSTKNMTIKRQVGANIRK